jgi:hypothetical protein
MKSMMENASFHMTPHRERFCDYEKYDGDIILARDDLREKSMGRGRVKLMLKDGRVETLPGVLHILGLARNLINMSNMIDAGV